MKIEILFFEICNLFGDSANVRFLKQCLPDAEFVQTRLCDTPQLADDTDLIYMGPMTENTQKLVVEKLSEHRERLSQLIDRGTHFLCTGNSFEVFGSYIENGKERIDGLGLLDFYSVCDTKNRYHELFLGEYEGIKITAFNSRFSHSFSKEQGFIKVLRGAGINRQAKLEGVKKNNFYGTYLLGPLLVLNPIFTKKLLAELGADTQLAFEQAAMDAYKVRLEEFEDEKREL